MPQMPNWILTGTALGVLCIAMSAEPKPETRTHLLAGTWELARAAVAQPDGTVVVDANYGPAAKGLLIIDRAGRYSLQIFRPARPKFASGDKARGTPDEYAAAVMGMSTHTGRISVDAAGHRLVFHIEQAAFPNWENTEQTRSYELSGELLAYRIPPGPNGTSAISEWRRVRSGS